MTYLNTIINIKTKPTPQYDIYIGRANKWLNLEESKWHNPFPMFAEYQRYECLEQFYNYIVKQNKLIQELHELDGKILACYCAPRFCHGDILRHLRKKQMYKWSWKNTLIEELHDIFINFGD